MKKFIVLALLMFASVTYASADVIPTLDVDVGVELVSNFDSVSADVTLEANDFPRGNDFDFIGAGILEQVVFINTTFFVPDFLEADLYRRLHYNQLYKNTLEQPPLETIKHRMSSCSLVDNQVSLRA